MLIRNSSAIAGALAITAATSAQTPRNLQLQSLPGREAFAHRAASFEIIDGRMLLTSEWYELGGPTMRGTITPAFDSAEHHLSGDAIGGPTDQPAPGGCSALIQEGSRWRFALPAYNNPFVAADMNPTPGFHGAVCKLVTPSWYIAAGQAEPEQWPTDGLFMAIQTFETMDVSGCTDDGSNPVPNSGVIYEFWPPDERPGSFYYAILDLRGTPLSHTLPSSPNGGYQVILGIAYDPVTGEITVPTGIDPLTQVGFEVQLMLWGTGDHEPVPDGRAGTEVDGQFDDDNPSNGQHDLAIECYSYLYGVCPDPLAPSVAFYVATHFGCPCPGDIDMNGVRDLADLAQLLSAFGANSEDCTDINADGIVNLADLAQFLATFGTPC